MDEEDGAEVRNRGERRSEGEGQEERGEGIEERGN